MHSIIKKHIIFELENLQTNLLYLQQLEQDIIQSKYIPTNAYFNLSKRINSLLYVISQSKVELQQLYSYRYIDNLTWFDISYKLNVSEITAKRYHIKLLENIATCLGWI